jgi:hypothetical protein
MMSLILNIFLFRSGVSSQTEDEMEEHYKGTTIMITAGLADRRLRWKPTCRVKFTKGEREVIQALKLDLDYGTSQQAERAGLVFSKLWVDGGKPTILDFKAEL